MRSELPSNFSKENRKCKDYRDQSKKDENRFGVAEEGRGKSMAETRTQRAFNSSYGRKAMGWF